MGVKYISASLEVSRGAVLKPEKVKEMIDCLAKMGYNTLMLYAEDLYEMPEYPMFGYMRGKYSKETLKELVAYAKGRGVMMMPCVEVLAHLEHIFRWKEFAPVRDMTNILLVDEPKTYELIDNMIKTMREIFDADLLLLGCDEAAMLGKGNFLKRFGYEDQKSIFRRHMKKCVEICHKYGFTPQLYHDMFFSMATGADCYTDNPDVITPEITALMPENAQICYWDYFASANRAEKMMEGCLKFGCPISFWTSICSWTGAIPHNQHAFHTHKRAIPVCVKMGAETIHASSWGDDGAECSLFACLPAFFSAAKYAQGVEDLNDVKDEFEELFGISLDDLVKLDLPGDFFGTANTFYSEKPFVFNDPFVGIYDDLVPEDREAFRRNMLSHVNELAPLCGHEKYGYLFRSASAMCEMIAAKFDLGVKTRLAYKESKEAVKAVLPAYTEAYDKVSAYFEAFREVWNTENKSNGFEVQAIRYGGLKERLLDCRRRLEDYADGRISVIEELEEEIKVIHTDEDYKENKYGKIATINTLTHYGFGSY